MFQSTTSRHLTNWLWIALFLVFGAGAAQAESRWVIYCGDLGQRPCQSGDHIYDSVVYNASSGIGLSFGHQACDLALNIGPDGLCGNYQGNGGLRTIIGTTKNPACGPDGNQPSCWLDFAMKQQRFGIQSDQAMNWITILGTHNSFSNYQDGGFNSAGINFNIDQQYSITDQLDAGARVIRLDPISYGITTPDLQNSDIDLRMCHQSSNTDSGTAAECHPTAYGRLFAYGIHEVEQWLERNPGEVVVMRMYRVANGDIDTIDGTLFNNTNGTILYPPAAATAFGVSPIWSPAETGWPTMRQMRTMNKNLIIFSDNQTNLSFPWGGGNTPGNNVVDDGYSESSGFNSAQCLNQSGFDVRQRAFNQWGYIGEDRSGSNYSRNSPYNLLDENAVTTAANCGFGMIAVDFLLAGDKAAKVPLIYDFTFSNDDKRREAAIWSWDQNDFGDQGPAYLKTNFQRTDAGYGRWSSQAAGGTLPFACAMDHPVVSNPANYDWVISTQTGPWSAGPYICGNLAAKFWAPQSALENQRLIAAVQAQRPGTAVWLNYNASPHLILEPVSMGLVAGTGPNHFIHNYTFAGAGNRVDDAILQYTGGIGGVLSMLPLTAQPVLFSQATFDTQAKSVVISHNPNLALLQQGSYTQNFLLTEISGSQSITQEVSITVNVNAPPPPVNVTITVNSAPQGRTVYVDNVAYVTPRAFSWTSGSEHTLDASHPDPTGGVEQIFQSWSGGGPNTFIYRVPDANASLTANFKLFYYLALNAGTGGELDVSPKLGDGFYTAGTSVNVTAKADSGYQLAAFSGALTGTTNPQTLIMSQPRYVVATFAPKSFNVTVQARPANAVIYVDNYAYIGTTKFTWPFGSTHTLDASKTDDGGGTHQAFTNWSIAAPVTFSFAVPNGDTSITGSFKMSYLLTAIITGSGTMTESPSSVNGYYAAGTKVAITATPAAGYTFVGFAGALNGLANPQNLTMSGPLPVQAVFNPLAPNLTAQAQLIGGGSGSVERVGLRFSNTGTAVATAVQLGSASVTVVSGTGAVTVTTVLPLNFGNVAAGAVSAAQEMDLNWPTSATSVELFVTCTANGGAYQSSQRWSFSRQSGGTDN